MNKERNSYCLSALNWGNLRCKHLVFFDSTQRKKIKKVIDFETQGLDGFPK